MYATRKANEMQFFKVVGWYDNDRRSQIDVQDGHTALHRSRIL